MSTFTPGPWRAYCRDVRYKGGEWSEDEFLQWEVEGPRVPSGRGEFFQSDALLIASAPDLLDALRDALEFIDDHVDVRDGSDGRPLPNRAMQLAEPIRAVIAKAEGKA